MKKGIIIILTLIILATGAAYMVNAAGIVLFGGNLHRDVNDGLVLDVTLASDNYASSTKTFTDNSRGSNHCVSTNAAVFTVDNYGKSTGATIFNGTTDVITRSTLNLGSAATFSGWGKADALTTRMLWNHPTNSYGTYFDLFFGNNLILMNTGDGYGNPFKYDNGTNIPLSAVSLNVWHHYVVVLDPVVNKSLLYIDGVYWGSAVYKNPTSNTSRILSIGGATSYRWSGAISSLKINSRALSASEVAKLYNSAKPKMQGASLEKGLIGYWPLDGENYNASDNRVTDKSAYSNHGTALNAFLSTGKFNEDNGSFDFGSINDGYSINIPSQNFQGLADFTMSAWIYLKGSQLHYDGTILSSGNWNNTHWSFGIAQNNSGIKTRNPSASISYNFEINRWYQVTYVREGSNLKFYIDGNLITTSVNSSNNPLTSGYPNTKIGMDTYTSNYFNFNGKISDVRVYNRALSSEEIGQLYSNHKPKMVSNSLQKGLVLDMPLTSNWTKSSTTGSQIMTDRTPYSNDGKNYGAVIGSDFASFDGNDYIADIVSKSILEPASITVSSWINMDTDAPLARNIWLTKWYGYSMEIQATTRIPYFRLQGPGDTVSNTALTLGQWHHFVGTYDPAIGRRVYLDGNLVGSGAANGAITHTRDFPLNIGRYAGGIYFKGKIKNVKIYDRALSAVEVRSLYDKER